MKHKVDKNFYENLGNNLRMERIAAGITSSEISHQLGVSHQQIAKYEKGEDRIDLQKFIKYCMAVNKNIVEMLEQDSVQDVRINRPLIYLTKKIAKLRYKDVVAINELVKALAKEAA